MRYHPYIERAPGEGKGLVAALAKRAAVVVTDDFPCFFLPRMVAATGNAIDVALEAVDSNGLLPIRAVTQVCPTAYAFRRALQKLLPAHLHERPSPDPLAGRQLPAAGPLPDAIATRWPHALDGRNPNSYSGIFWIFGRYDRPWFPNRPIFGVVRYMSSENTARKVRVKEYIRRYGVPDGRLRW